MLNAIVDFIVPGSPARRTTWPSGMPPPSLSSKPWMKVRIRSPWPIARHSIGRSAYNRSEALITGSVPGYLKALADAGILRAKHIPPAKVYGPSARREPNLYELVGSRCREATREETDQVRLAVAVLQKLFRRPIFLRELRECGFGGAIDAPQPPRGEREEARRGLVKPDL